MPRTDFIDVAVAIIVDEQRRVLITRRASTGEHPGFWEFPGGKVEPDETPDAALVREIQEEVNLTIQAQTFLTVHSHSYPKYDVALHLFHVTKFTGNAACCEAQLDLQWVPVSDLNTYAFLPANGAIIARVNTIV